MTWTAEKRIERAEYNLCWRRNHPTTRSNWPQRILPFVRYRAKRQGLPFDLCVQDIYVPAVCPALGVPLVFGGRKNHPYGPSIDKIKPELGYVRGNIAVISSRANMIKHDATASELYSVAAWASAQGA